MKNILEILKSLLITITICFVITIPTYYLTNSIKFTLIIFSLSFVLQYIISFIIKDYLSKKLEYIKENTLSNKLLALSQQTLLVKCEYCNTNNLATIILNENNTFKCTSCNNKNSIYLTVKVTRTTDLNKIESQMHEQSKIFADLNVAENKKV